jgi:hypothetical protein
VLAPEATAVMIPLFDFEDALSEINTVCPTLKAILAVPERLEDGINVSETVIVAVSAPAAAPEAQLTYLVCRRPCSAHLIRSDVDGISAPTALKKDATERFPYRSNSFS